MLLVLIGLVFVAPPANAALSVTISASRTTLPHGASVTFSGRAVDAKPGSVVRLQRKAAAGWRTVASKKVRATRSYRFSTTPPKGYQYYRVVKPRQLRQVAAVSRTVKLIVRWRPSVVLGAVTHDVDVTTGTVRTTTDGTTTGLPEGTGLRREIQRVDGTWARHGWTAVDADHTWSDTFAGSHDMRLRYTAPAAGPRRAASSVIFVVDGRWTPTVTIEHTRELLRVDGADGAHWHNDVRGTAAGSAEEEVVLQKFDGTQWVLTEHRAPVADDGSYRFFFLDWTLRNVLLRVCLPASGARREGCSAPVTTDDSPFYADVQLDSVTSTIREATSPDGPVHIQEAVVTGSTDLPPGVRIDVRYRHPGQEWKGFHGAILATTGEFTLTAPTPPDGTEIDLVVPAVGDVARVESDVLSYELKPFRIDLNDPPLRIANIPTQRGALLEFDAAAGEILHPRVYKNANVPVDEWIEGPDGTRIERHPIDLPSWEGSWYHQAPTAGRYTLVLSSAQAWQWTNATADVLTPVRSYGPSYHDTTVRTEKEFQTAEYHFQGVAGQVVTLFRHTWSKVCADVDLIPAANYNEPLPRMFGPTFDSGQIWRLPADGEYLYRVTPCSHQTVSYRLWSPPPVTQHLEVSKDVQEVAVPAGAWFKLTFEAQAGDHIRLEMTDDPTLEMGSADRHVVGGVHVRHMLAPDGSTVPWDFTAEQSGTYTVWAEQAGYDTDTDSVFRVLLRELNA